MNETSDLKTEKYHRPRKPRWFRFGFRLLFLFVTVIAVALALTMKRLHDRKSAVETIHKARGTMGVSIRGPEWLRKIINDDECFYEPQRVSLGPIAKDNPDLDDALLASVAKSLSTFRELQVLDIRRADITDSSAPDLATLTSIEHLRLSDTGITDESIKHICRLPKLQSLWLTNTRLTDNCVDQLCEIRTLTDLDLRGTGISEDAIRRLQKSLPACRISN